MKVATDLVQVMDALERAIAAGSFNGYGLLPIPHDLDTIPTQLVESYPTASQAEKDLLPSLSKMASRVLLAFSERQSSLAVREQSGDALRCALLAVGLVAAINDDERQGLLVMPLAWRSAALLRLHPKRAFLAAADHLPLPGQRALIAFTHRKPEDQTLACMGYAEGCDKDGFRYTRTW